MTNPFYSTSDSTYGITQNQYDALDRVTQTTKQDGSVSTVSYIDNCTITTDEAGKQRRSCANALGQLTSVDEPGDSSAGASPVSNGGGTAATGTITIAGSEQVTNAPPTPGGGGGNCDPGVVCDSDGGGGGGGPTYIYDQGTVSITVGGRVYSAVYGQGATPAGLAASLAAAINGDAFGPVTASAFGATVNLRSRATGSQISYSLSAAWIWDAVDFSGPSFTASSSGGVGGGTDGPPVFGGHAYTTLYSYDVLGNLLKVTQQGGTSDQSKWRIRLFTYNSLGQLLTANNPESGLISYVYDADGEMTSKTDARGTTISYGYDSLHRLRTKSYSDGSPLIQYLYDRVPWYASGDSIGRLVETCNGSSVCSFFNYDVLGRLTLENNWIPSNQNVATPVSASYNLGGDLKQLTYPNGEVVTYTPDSAGRILSAVDSGNGINFVTGATYGPDSALTGFHQR